MTEQEYFKLLIVGASGRGKTFAARNLGPNTGLINAENKPLPFKSNIKYHVRPTNYIDTYKQIVELGKNPEVECIVLDSFSAYTDSLLSEIRKTKKGFDIWSMYNEEIGKVLNLIKMVPKHVFITAHYEVLSVDGGSEKRVKVKAKEWEGLIEKEFTVVLYANSGIDSKTGKPEYWLNTFQQGTSAKCPPDLFGPDVLKIPNDYAFILNKVEEFTKPLVTV